MSSGGPVHWNCSSELHQAGIPCGLVTMSEGPMATLVLSLLPKKYFAFQVTGDQVARGKPHPDPYLLGLEKLSELVPDLESHRVVGIEDSAPGHHRGGRGRPDGRAGSAPRPRPRIGPVAQHRLPGTGRAPYTFLPDRHRSTLND